MKALQLKKIRTSRGLSREQFAEKLGITLETLNTWEYRNKEVPKDKVAYVKSVFPEDENKIHTIYSIEESASMYNAHEKAEVSKSIHSIPYYNIDFAGGWESEELFSTASPDFYINNPEFDRSEFACNLFGHSISRRIPSRSIIGLKQVSDWQIYFPTNELYAVVMKNNIRTVKIVKRSKKTGFLTLIPDPLPEYNQTQYEPEEVPIEFVSKFYQIIAWAQFERIAQ